MIRSIPMFLFDNDWHDKWQEGMKDIWAQDVSDFAVAMTVMLCILAVSIVLIVVVHILSKKNDFGDEDFEEIRKNTGGKAEYAGSDLGAEISSGSLICMKNFHYEEVNKDR